MISEQHVSLHPFLATHLFLKRSIVTVAQTFSANFNVIIISVSLKCSYLCNFILPPQQIHSNVLTAALWWKSPRVNTQNSSLLRNDSLGVIKSVLHCLARRLQYIHMCLCFITRNISSPASGGYMQNQQKAKCIHIGMTPRVVLQLLKRKGPGNRRESIWQKMVKKRDERRKSHTRAPCSYLIPAARME